MNSTVLALAIGLDGSIYSGGSFSTAGGVAASGVARWDGTAWQPLGSGVDRSVMALAVGTDGSLYVGGEFTAAGGATANHIARWDGAAWQPLDSGMDNFVNALAAVPDGSIYAGGAFTTAGDLPSSSIARWEATAPSATTLVSLDAASDEDPRAPGWLVVALLAIVLVAAVTLPRRNS